MDTVRFLNFLQSFASSASTRMQSQPEAESLSSTLSAFESQLRALMAPDQPKAGAVAPSARSSVPGDLAPAGSALTPWTTVADLQPTLNESPPTSAFVIGGSAPALPAVAMPAPDAAIADRAVSAPGADAAPVRSSGFNPPLEDLQKIVAWQREQINPMLHVRIGETWERQGIADPLNHPGLLAQAQQVFERAANFKAHMPGYVAAWEKPWQESAPVQMASSQPDTSGFVTGGRG